MYAAAIPFGAFVSLTGAGMPCLTANVQCWLIERLICVGKQSSSTTKMKIILCVHKLISTNYVDLIGALHQEVQAVIVMQIDPIDDQRTILKKFEGKIYHEAMFEESYWNERTIQI